MFAVPFKNKSIVRKSLSLKRGNKNNLSKECNNKQLELYSIDIQNQKNKPNVIPTIYDSGNIAEDASQHFLDVQVLGNDKDKTETESFPFSFNYSQIEICEKTTNVKRSKRSNITSLVSEDDSLRFSDIQVLRNDREKTETESFPFSYNNSQIEIVKENTNVNRSDNSQITLPSEIELISESNNCISDTTVVYNLQPKISVSFSVNDCNNLDISTNKSNIKKVSVIHHETNASFNCDIVAGSQLSNTSGSDNCFNMNEPNSQSPNKRKVDSINLEIKKRKMTTGEQSTENAKVLILKTNAIEKLTDVIVQPPNYKLVKRKIKDKSKVENGKRLVKNGKRVKNCDLKQKFIDNYFRSTCEARVLKTKLFPDKSAFILCSNNERNNVCEVKKLVRDDAQEMSRNLSVADVKHDGFTSYKSNRNDLSRTPRNAQRLPSPKQDIKASNSDVPRTVSPKAKKDSAGSFSSRRRMESIQFSLPLKSQSNKSSTFARSNIPYYKIVAGTHFAVDAFSYGEIPNVRHYFLTHFHSDHYSGLKKSFNKLLFCSKITADLCISRLGVNSKYIQVINVDETLKIEGVEVTVVDANHCPGAIMLVFSLPNGKTMLHTGDFRASPVMESFPVFWNKDVHTIYLDTTYCNPRYDFPTQDQSLEMALFFLRQKKMALEKIGKKFSTVLIVCGTYTIGKEKFFLGMAKRVGCSVWACPEKDRVLQAVEGRSFSRASPETCQLHVVPMRDLTHEKLRSYLDSLQGAFSEVVAFKPSGWENGKNSSVEKNSVTIHGVPYSEHSSFSELVRFVKFLKPKQVVPTVDISGGIKAVQKHFPCPLVTKDDIRCQSKVTDYFSMQSRQVTDVT